MSDSAANRQEPLVKVWLTARPDGSHPKVVRATSALGALRSRVRDEDDVVTDGVWATWRLGNFPTRYDLSGDDPLNPREIGNPHV